MWEQEQGQRKGGLGAIWRRQTMKGEKNIGKETYHEHSLSVSSRHIISAKQQEATLKKSFERIKSGLISF
jgi:hypothetical protein